MINSMFSFIPPLLVIGMIAATKKIIPSILAGIIASALMLNQFDPLTSLQSIVQSAVGIFYTGGKWNTDNILLILFILGLGIITSFVEKNGGARGFASWAQKHVKSAATSQLLAVFLGVLIFIDDYFNALTVGEVSRGLTDKYRVSREKLAYLIDSTSAPVCSICPLSSWGAYIIALFAVSLPQTTAPLGHFIGTIPYNFYAIFALGVVLLSAGWNINIGKMRDVGSIARMNQKNRGVREEEEGMEHGADRASDLAIPVLLLVAVSLFVMYVTGLKNSGSFDIFEILENASTYLGLFAGCVAAMIYCGYRYYKKHGHHPLRVMERGVRSVAGATVALLFAWVLVDMISSLEIGTFLSGIILKYEIPSTLLPVLLFLLSALMALATGFSWGVFGMMLPISVQITQSLDLPMMMVYCCLGAVLSGSVFGDHCSPIADTTILSSAGAQCDHVEHVISQMPYALFSGIVAAIGFLVIGVTRNLALSLALQLALLFAAAMMYRTGEIRRSKRGKKREIQEKREALYFE